jgi:hypothetical protein
VIEMTVPAATPHADVTAPLATPLANPGAQLDAIAQAHADGDAPHAELLFIQALDDGLPWDQVCTAAARGITQRYGGPERG